MHFPDMRIRTLDFDRDALFLDVDGTLLDIAATPESVVVPEGLVDNIARLETALGGALAIVTGRTLADLDRLFHPLRTPAAGVHGAQMRFAPNEPAPIEQAGALPARLWGRLSDAAREFPDALLENKRFSFAVHFRARPEIAAPLRSALQRLVDEEPEFDLELLAAHFAFEIKPRNINKGLAIRRLLAHPPFAGRIPVFIGDDVTDEHGFAAVVDQRGLAYSVGLPRPSVTDVFPDPATVRRWLEGLAARPVAQ